MNYLSKKIVSLTFIILFIVIGYIQKDPLLLLVEQGGTLSIFISILLVSICVFFPIIPFPLLAGMIGVVFGVLQGIVISLTGAMIGTILMFMLTRYGFRDFAQQKLHKHPKIQQYEEYFEKNSFISILFVRIVPIIPSPVVNILCGLSRVNWLSFLLASSFGKFPNILVITFAGANLSANKWVSVTVYGTYVIILLMITSTILYRRTASTKPDSIN